MTKTWKRRREGTKNDRKKREREGMGGVEEREPNKILDTTMTFKQGVKRQGGEIIFAARGNTDRIHPRGVDFLI